MGNPVRQFLVYVALLLLPCFALWTAIAAPLALPATGLVNLLLSSWFPDLVHAVAANGADAVILTQFGESNGKVIPLVQAEYRLGFELNTRILSYSLPFYTALHFANQKKAYLGSYLSGIFVLYALFTIGLTILCMKELQQQLPDPFAGQQAIWVPGTNMVAILYQLSVLIIPTLAPVALWVFQNRGSKMLQELLQNLPKEQKRGSQQADD